MKTQTEAQKLHERELKRADGTIYAIEHDHKLCCGHIERGVPGKIPHHHATGLFCHACNAWIAVLR